jgi:hypothetical protein
MRKQVKALCYRSTRAVLSQGKPSQDEIGIKYRSKNLNSPMQ